MPGCLALSGRYLGVKRSRVQTPAAQPRWAGQSSRALTCQTALGRACYRRDRPCPSKRRRSAMTAEPRLVLTLGGGWRFTDERREPIEHLAALLRDEDLEVGVVPPEPLQGLGAICGELALVYVLMKTVDNLTDRALDAAIDRITEPIKKWAPDRTDLTCGHGPPGSCLLSRRSDRLMSRVHVSQRGGGGSSSGCLGSLVIGLVYVLGAVLFIGALVLILGVFVAAVLVALVALGVNRLLMAISPRYRERRVAQGAFRPTTKVIETTARVIDTTKPKRRD